MVLLSLAILVPTFKVFAQDDLIPPPVDTPTPPPAEAAPASPVPTAPGAGAATVTPNAAPGTFITPAIPERPWLEDLYSWNETFDIGHQPVQANETGAYCVGNGRTFALVGMTSPLWTLSNIYGASYQEPDLGGLKMSVTRAGLDNWMAREQIGWVRRSGVVRVAAEGGGLTVESFDFAPVTVALDGPWENPPALIRMVHVINNGNQAEGDLDIALKVQPGWNIKLKQKTDGKEVVLDQSPGHTKKRTLWRLGAFDSKNVRVWDNEVHYGVPSLAPGKDHWAFFFLVSADSLSDNKALASQLKSANPFDLLDQTRDYYQKWYAEGTQFLGDPKVADLFDVDSFILKCVQAHSGGFSPLIGYSYTWIRDNNGPIRWFLKTGHPKEARGPMDFFYGVASTMGVLPSSIGVNYSLNYHKKDLSALKVDHAETPSWIVLQHWWYYLTTGDLEYIRGRWNYLKRCIEGQVNTDDKYFFNRDETYLWCFESRVFDHVDDPNYFLGTHSFAVDSSFDIVSAADHLAYLGKFLEMDKDVASLKKFADRVRSKTEETYWDEKAGFWAPAQSFLGTAYHSPFANILFNPFWCGYARNDLDPLGETPEASQRAQEALRSGYLYLGRDDGFWKTTPTVDYFVGMNPGQLLTALCKARSPWAGKVFQDVLKTMTPSGEAVEMNDGNYRPWNPPSWGVGTSGRLRPWETGLDAESLLDFLTGFQPDAGDNRAVFAPHLPEEMKEFSANGLVVGQARVSLSLKRDSKKEWTATLHLDKGQPLDVVLELWPSRRALANVECDGAVTWDKTVVETNGRESRCHLSLEQGKDVQFTVTEDGNLPDAELNPPKAQPFQPEPYSVDNADLLLVTSPAGLLHLHKHNHPEDYVDIGLGEVRAARKAAPSVSLLDADMPLQPEDIAHALLDEKGLPRFRVAVFGQDAFGTGKQNFKTTGFWASSKIGRAARKFVEQGGCLFIGPGDPDRESQPDWLVSLTGGWSRGEDADRARVPDDTKSAASQKYVDEIKVDDAGSEAAHGVTVAGATFADSIKLPDGANGQKIVEEQGRGFTGSYRFSFKTLPGSQHRIWFKVDTGRNIKGLALQVAQDGKWHQLGVRTQDGGPDRRFLALYFDVPASYVTSDHTLFRLVSKTREEVNVFHLWVYQVAAPAGESLPQVVGLSPNQDYGTVSEGLQPKGKAWQPLLSLAGHPDQSAVMIQKVGNGFIVRSELPLEDSTGLLKALLKPEVLKQLADSWPES